MINNENKLKSDEKTSKKLSTENANYVILAAKHSRNNAKHWARYLRKEIVNGEVRLSKEEIDYLLNSDALTPFQKIFLKRGMTKDTLTYEYLKSLNEPIKKEKIQRLLRGLTNAKNGREVF